MFQWSWLDGRLSHRRIGATYVRVKCMKDRQTIADHVEDGEEQPEGEEDAAGVRVLSFLVQCQHEGDHLRKKTD